MKFKKVKKILNIGRDVKIEKMENLENGKSLFSVVATFGGIDQVPDDYDNYRVHYIDMFCLEDNDLGYRVGLSNPTTLKHSKKVNKKDTKCSGSCNTCKECEDKKKSHEKVSTNKPKKEKKKEK